MPDQQFQREVMTVLDVVPPGLTTYDARAADEPVRVAMARL
jgi:hypothetical protein